jgi:hypothetical protein
LRLQVLLVLLLEQEHRRVDLAPLLQEQQLQQQVRLEQQLLPLCRKQQVKEQLDQEQLTSSFRFLLD